MEEQKAADRLGQKAEWIKKVGEEMVKVYIYCLLGPKPKTKTWVIDNSEKYLLRWS